MEITSRYLAKIGACSDARQAFRKELNGNKSMTIPEIFTRLKKIDRLDWANWLIVRIMSPEQRIRYAIYAAEQVIGTYEKEYPNDKRPREAIEAAKKYLNKPTEENRSAAWSAAWSAARSAWSAAESAWSAWSAARSAWSAAESAWSAWSAAESAAESAWSAAESAACRKMRLKILNYGLRLIKIDEALEGKD